MTTSTTLLFKNRYTSVLTAVILTAVASMTLAACGGDDASSSTQASIVTVQDPWVKEVKAGMTAAFGTLKNDSDSKVVVVAASSTVAGSMELHEMAPDDAGKMVMRAKKDGFVIPAGGTHKLGPGADHLMFMDVIKPIKAGDMVTVTLTFADKSTMKFTAPVRTFSGANENYEGDDMSGMDKGDMSDD